MDLIELQQCIDEESAANLVGILNRAQIPYSQSKGNPSFDVSTLGSSSESGNAKIIISVPRDQFDQARAAMEEDSLKNDLPADHHLLHSSIEELQELIVAEREWSAFDVAHAKRLLDEQGIKASDLEKIAAERITALQKGKSASKKLRFFGWAFSLSGGFLGLLGIFSLIGFGIGWSLSSMKEKTPDGDFHTYNKETQASGQRMMGFAVITWLASVIWLSSLLH